MNYTTSHLTSHQLNINKKNNIKSSYRIFAGTVVFTIIIILTFFAAYNQYHHEKLILSNYSTNISNDLSLKQNDTTPQPISSQPSQPSQLSSPTSSIIISHIPFYSYIQDFSHTKQEPSFGFLRENDNNTKIPCEHIERYPDPCEFISNNDECPVDGYINWLGLRYCTLKHWNNVKGTIFVGSLLGIAALILITALGQTADVWLVPSLAQVSTELGLCPPVAGLTFLAFGNGSPDILTTISSVGQDDLPLAVGSLSGAAVCISCFVLGISLIAAPIGRGGMPIQAFIRNMCCYCLCLFPPIIMCWYGELHLYSGIIMVVLYILTTTGQIIYLQYKRASANRRQIILGKLGFLETIPKFDQIQLNYQNEDLLLLLLGVPTSKILRYPELKPSSSLAKSLLKLNSSQHYSFDTSNTTNSSATEHLLLPKSSSTSSFSSSSSSPTSALLSSASLIQTDKSLTSQIFDRSLLPSQRQLMNNDDSTVSPDDLYTKSPNIIHAQFDSSTYAPPNLSSSIMLPNQPNTTAKSSINTTVGVVTPSSYINSITLSDISHSTGDIYNLNDQQQSHPNHQLFEHSESGLTENNIDDEFVLVQDDEYDDENIDGVDPTVYMHGLSWPDPSWKNASWYTGIWFQLLWIITLPLSLARWLTIPSTHIRPDLQRGVKRILLHSSPLPLAILFGLSLYGLKFNDNIYKWCILLSLSITITISLNIFFFFYVLPATKRYTVLRQEKRFYVEHIVTSTQLPTIQQLREIVDIYTNYELNITDHHAKSTSMHAFEIIIAIFGFFGSVLWLSIFANTIVDALQSLGIMFGISSTILGLTILAIGNSIPDIISDVSLAYNGKINISYGAIFGAPSLSNSAGFGLAIIIKCLKNISRQQSDIITLNVTHQFILCWGMIIFTTFCHLCVYIWTKFSPPKGYGFFLCFSYFGFLLAAVLLEIFTPTVAP